MVSRPAKYLTVFVDSQTTSSCSFLSALDHVSTSGDVSITNRIMASRSALCEYRSMVGAPVTSSSRRPHAAYGINSFFYLILACTTWDTMQAAR